MSIKQIAAITGLVFLLFISHELAHFLMAKALGNHAILTINHVLPAHGQWNSPAHNLPISAAGPAFTFLLAVWGFFLAMRRSSLLGLNLVVLAFVMRLLATIVSLNNPNDEVRISLDLGLGSWTIPALVVGALLVMGIIAWRKVKPGVWHLFHIWLGASIGMTAIVFGEPHLPSFTW